VYPLSRNEKEKVQKFMNEYLKKKYIRSLKLSQMLLVFFISKKDREKHIVIDYRRFNKQTIKYNYSLPLITDLVDSMGNYYKLHSAITPQIPAQFPQSKTSDQYSSRYQLISARHWPADILGTVKCGCLLLHVHRSSLQYTSDDYK